MHPFRTAPEPIDAVACGRCGHPAWDHYVSEACAECASRETWSACKRFALAGFKEAAPTTYEEFMIRA
jgi:hypothetical protein